MNGSRAKDVVLGSATDEVVNDENSMPASPSKLRSESGSGIERKNDRKAMDTDENPIVSSDGEQEDGEVSDGSNAALADDDGEIVDEDEKPVEKSRHRSNPTTQKVDEETEITKKSVLEKLKNMKFSSRSKVSVGSPSRDRRDRERKDRQTSSTGRSSPPRRENDEERRLRKRRWEEHNDEDRQAVRNVERARPLRDTISPVARPTESTRPVDQPSTLRQRIERIICLSEAEVSNLSDAELRSLIARMFEIDREQQRLYKGRRAQIEALQEMFMQAKDDVERLLKCLPTHMKADIPPMPTSLPTFQNEPSSVHSGTPLPAQVNGGICVPPPTSAMPAVFGQPRGAAPPAPTMSAVSSASSGTASSGVAGSGASLGGQPQPPLAYNAMNGPSAAQAPQEFGSPVSQPSSSGAPSFPVAPSLLNRPPIYGMATGMPSTNTTAAPPPFMNMPPPTTVPGQQPPRYGTPAGSASPFGRPPPTETAPSPSSLPNLSQPPPSIVTPTSGNIPPPDFSMPPPTSLSGSTLLPGDSTMSAPKTSVPSELSSSASSLTASSSVVTTATIDAEPSSGAPPAANPPSTSLPPPVNLSVPPPNFPLPPPRVGSVGPPPFSGPPPVPNTSLPPPGRGPVPQGPPPNMMVGPPPNIASGPPAMNIPVAPPMGGPLNLSCPPPNMNCPPPNIRPPVNLGNPQSVHQMVSAIVSRSAASGQTPVEVVTELIANAYNRGGGFGPMVPPAASGPPQRMSIPPPGLGPPMPGPPPSMGGPPPMAGGSNKLPTVNLSIGSHSRNVGVGSFRSFSGSGGGQARFGNRGQQQQQQQPQQQRRQISDIVAIIPDEHDTPDSREHHDDSNIFLIVSDEEDSGK